MRLCLVTGWLLASCAAASAFAQAPAAAPPAPSRFEQATAGMTRVAGMWTMYVKDQTLLVDLAPQNLNRDYLMLSSVARGISQGQVLGGMTWGDDVVWQFRKVGDKIHVVRRNVRFRAAPGSPESSAVQLAYSDSILYALPIITTTPTGGNLVDMSRIFMSDDEGIGRSLGMAFAPDRSTWAKIKAFENNVQIQVAAVYAGGRPFDTVIDPRGVQVNVHYSISYLPNTGYVPRRADDRVGYFLTVIKDFSDKKDDEQFIRYINRWNLKKKDPAARLSPPEKPIRFYIEKTLPVALRPVVKSGILEWNKAFEKLGFADAVEVWQQEDNDDKDPEDINYNFFRWITAEAGFAMGPSRVNPMTGEILDADIIFDASFMQSWRHDYENFSQQTMAALFGSYPDEEAAALGGTQHRHGRHCTLCQGMQHQMAFAGAVFAARGDVQAGKLPEEFVAQALKEVVMHEVGHTLGLRHNFKASAWKSLADIEAQTEGATVASVMDYTPSNIAPKGEKQGLYYPTTIGPYDYWAIEYGYKPIAGDEEKELKAIASRCAEPGLDYLTDEDTRGGDSDPASNRFDLSNDPVAFAQRQARVASELIPGLVDRVVEPGDGYQRARQAFGIVLGRQWQTAFFASRLPAGVYVARDHKGDPNGRLPFRIVEAEKQRAAMKLLQEGVFSVQGFPPELLNALAATRWSHWGINEPQRVDYAIHDTILRAQERMVGQLLAPLTLTRLLDNEAKVAAEGDAYTLAEHLRTLFAGIFSEVSGAAAGEYTPRKPLISSYRRNLQRSVLRGYIYLVTQGGGAPEDARSLARMHLAELDAQIQSLLARADVKLDDYSRSHLLDCQDRVRKVLNAQLALPSVQ